MIALLAALVLPGCGHDGATIPRERLSRLVLQPTDLPRGFSSFDEGKQVRADAHPGPREDPKRFGRVDGWKARYRWVGDRSARRPLVVESRADLFEDDGGAGEDLDAYREELESPPAGSGLRVTSFEPPKLGDGDAVGFRARQGQLLFVTIAWRRANATASVRADGFAGRMKVADAVALARRQARRLDAEASR